MRSGQFMTGKRRKKIINEEFVLGAETTERMSLVDYASSTDDDLPQDKEEGEDVKSQNQAETPSSSPTNTIPQPHNNSRSGSPLPENAPFPSPSSSLKLPDASLLLNSPTVSLPTATDHASQVAVAMTRSTLRKRDFNELPSSFPRTKVPKGVLPHSKSLPDTVGDMLIPPQLKGRSNIVTEDVGKLFVGKKC